MILHALNGYYERMLDDPDSEMPASGTSIEDISFALVLGEDGSLRAIEDLREQSGKKKRPRKVPVPAGVNRTAGVKANFLWDKAAYVFGADEKGATERNFECFTAFHDLLKLVGKDINDVGFSAVTKFLQNWDYFNSEETVTQHQQVWEDICTGNLVFRLDGIPGFIHDRKSIQNAWHKYSQDNSGTTLGQCLITGEKNTPLARIHTPVKGVRDAHKKGGAIVSFNKDAFESYGKKQSFNAPVSEVAAFNYSTALSSLLSVASRQKINIGDTTYVFWAKRSTKAESFLADLFDPPAENGETGEQDDQQTAGQVHGLLKAIRAGRRPVDFMPDLDMDVSFYILGLAPNAARLSIRFWQESSLGDLLEKVGRHYRQLNIVQQFDREPEFPSLRQLLLHTANLKGIKPTDSWDTRNKRISPIMVGGLTRAMLTGSPYPQNLLPVVLDRIRAEHNVTYFRAALIKAYLLRNTSMKEVPVALDLNRTDRPYLLGRLFAVLEKAQEEAIPGANATIKDRYLASAAATPGQVFHMLLKNSANHIAKLKKDAEKKGRAFYYDVMTQDIIAGFSDYPKTMKAEEQGLFMIGYYHQRKDFYTKKTQEG